MDDTLLESSNDVIQFNKGAVIFTEGEPSTYLYIIKSGEVRIVKKDKDRLTPITILKERDFLGELSMFSNNPRNATAIATSDTELIMVKKSDIKKVLNKCPDWVSDIMQTISSRLRDSDELLREHKIIDDKYESQNVLSPEEEVICKKAIDDYCKRMGI